VSKLGLSECMSDSLESSCVQPANDQVMKEYNEGMKVHIPVMLDCTLDLLV
jgi:hypothetical protein